MRTIHLFIVILLFSLLGTVLFLGIKNPQRNVIVDLLFIMGLGFTLFGIVKVWDASRTSSFPQVSGVILSSEVHELNEDDSTTYEAYVDYQYTIDNIERRSQQIFVGSHRFHSQDKAKEIAINYKKGDTVSVYYDPQKPEFAVLQPGIKRKTYHLIASGIFFFILALGFSLWKLN